MISTQNAMRIQRSQKLLLLTYSLLFILVGIDKFFNYFVDWQQFMSPFIQSILPINSFILIRLFGASQIILGLLLLLSNSLIIMYTALVMLIVIFINLVSIQSLNIVVAHDFCMIMQCIVLILLTQAMHSHHS